MQKTRLDPYAPRVAQFLNMTPPAVSYAVERGEGIVSEKGYVL